MLSKLFVFLGIVAAPFWLLYYMPRLIRIGRALADTTTYFRMGSAN